MGFFFFVIGVLVGVALLVLLPLFIAVLGVAAAIGLVIALPLIGAVLILIGIVALAHALGYGLVIAAILIALWLSHRRRRQIPWRG
jgi:antibiotic biosynthesis monooxygenase (ABM) superfamily enzyme